MADAVHANVAIGNHGTEGKVDRDGLRALPARDRDVEHWLRRDVASAHDALKDDPSRAVTGEAIRLRLASARRKA